MSYMSDRVFIDTNILIYAYTLDEPPKHDICKEIVKKVFLGNTRAAVSNQIIGELSRALLNKFNSPLAEVEKVVDELILYKNLDKVNYTSQTIRKALFNCKTYAVPFWDSIIAETMKENGMAEIITENEKDFQRIPGIKVANPFRTK